VPTGGRCGVEALTYPYVKSIAARLGVTLVPIPMDEYGARPDAIQKAHREAHLSALYLQPIIQNPLGVTMNATRRADIMRVAEKLDLTIIEDTVYGFLADDMPLAALGPDRCIVLDSLSKKVAPGLALGILVPPPHLRESLMSAVRTGGWIASGHALAAGQRLMADGTVAELTRLKRIDAARRQQTAARLLAGYQLAADPRSYHLWLTLPPHWRSQTFVAAAARRGIALTPSSTFAIAHGHAPNAVRLALAPPSLEQLDSGLRTIVSLLGTKEEDFDSTE
jgi:DNA-binding transcriptional MocR family regulator